VTFTSCSSGSKQPAHGLAPVTIVLLFIIDLVVLVMGLK
jgi:hypothetical protein